MQSLSRLVGKGSKQPFFSVTDEKVKNGHEIRPVWRVDD